MFGVAGTLDKYKCRLPPCCFLSLVVWKLESIYSFFRVETVNPLGLQPLKIIWITKDPLGSSKRKKELEDSWMVSYNHRDREKRFESKKENYNIKVNYIVKIVI